MAKAATLVWELTKLMARRRRDLASLTLSQQFLPSHPVSPVLQRHRAFRQVDECLSNESRSAYRRRYRPKKDISLLANDMYLHGVPYRNDGQVADGQNYIIPGARLIG